MSSGISPIKKSQNQPKNDDNDIRETNKLQNLPEKIMIELSTVNNQKVEKGNDIISVKSITDVSIIEFPMNPQLEQDNLNRDLSKVNELTDQQSSQTKNEIRNKDNKNLEREKVFSFGIQSVYVQEKTSQKFSNLEISEKDDELLQSSDFVETKAIDTNQEDLDYLENLKISNAKQNESEKNKQNDPLKTFLVKETAQVKKSIELENENDSLYNQKSWDETSDPKIEKSSAKSNFAD